jgi:hypothetical protein
MLLQQVQQADRSSVYLSLISAMITPVFLIVASGSMVNATLQRMIRVTDRARTLIGLIREDHDNDDHAAEGTYLKWLENYRRRSVVVERALISYYCAIGLFVLTSLSIAFDRLLHDAAPWLAVITVVAGAAMLFLGTVFLLLETLYSSGQLRQEMDYVASHIGHEMVADGALEIFERAAP